MKKQLVILLFIILLFIIPALYLKIMYQTDIEPPIQNIIYQKNISDEKIIQIKYDEIPSYADSKVVNKAIIDAIDRWSTINDNLTIQISSSDNYDIYIEWKTMLEHNQISGEIRGNLMKVKLGKIDCDNNWRDYSMNAISDIISHEIGHYLGLEHTSNKNQVMYGDTNEIMIKAEVTTMYEITPVPYYFDDLGYNIPLINSISRTWNISDEISTEYDELMIKHEILLKEFNQYEERPDNEWSYDESMKIYERLYSLESEMFIFDMKIYDVDCQNYAMIPEMYKER